MVVKVWPPAFKSSTCPTISNYSFVLTLIFFFKKNPNSCVYAFYLVLHTVSTPTITIAITIATTTIIIPITTIITCPLYVRISFCSLYASYNNPDVVEGGASSRHV